MSFDTLREPSPAYFPAIRNNLFNSRIMSEHATSETHAMSEHARQMLPFSHRESSVRLRRRPHSLAFALAATPRP